MDLTNGNEGKDSIERPLFVKLGNFAFTLQRDDSGILMGSCETLQLVQPGLVDEMDFYRWAHMVARKEQGPIGELVEETKGQEQIRDIII